MTNFWSLTVVNNRNESSMEIICTRKGGGGMNYFVQFILASLLTFASFVKANEITFVHQDHLGSPILETTENGQIKNRYYYEPFGKSLSGDKKDEPDYTGHVYDDDLNLVYMQARYYDPLIGRFYSNDPVGFIEHLNGGQGIQGFNRYAYVNNNPYRYTDPDGRKLKQLLKGPGNIYRAFRDAYRTYKKNKQLEKNKQVGEAFEKQVKEQLEKTDTDVAEQVTIKTKSGTKTRVDLVSKDKDGNIKCTECKSSETAPLTKNQKQAFPEIEESGGTVVGKGKPEYPGGTEIPPTKVDVVRP
ncbi:tRNA3(Ser)-specific nuclease WapA [Thalassocella blandensis]|nr:tRNA3(Ser)-specific nuclease WapA [Thalassocella blandensis]